MSRLQKEIKQNRPFPDLQSEALLSIVRTAALLDHQINETLKPYGLTTTQFNVLRILRGAGNDGLCGKDIADRLVSPAPDVARLLDRMEEMAVIVRQRNPEDRRYVTTRITPKGLALLTEVDPPLLAIQAERMGDLPASTLKSLIEILDSIR